MKQHDRVHDNLKDVQAITHYRDRPISDLSRDELIAALTDVAGQLANLNSPSASRARTLGRVEMLKRGE